MRLSDKEKTLLRMALRNFRTKVPQVGDQLDQLMSKIDGCAGDKPRTLTVASFADFVGGKPVNRRDAIASLVDKMKPSDVVSLTTRYTMHGCVTEVWYWKDSE
jgi:hypothetical protein